jgi:hypothetical protein
MGKQIQYFTLKVFNHNPFLATVKPKLMEKSVVQNEPILDKEKFKTQIISDAKWKFPQEEFQQFCIEFEKWLKSDVASSNWDWLINNQNRKGLFSEFFWLLHLRQRKPLPFGENYSIILSKLSIENIFLRAATWISSMIGVFKKIKLGAFDSGRLR